MFAPAIPQPSLDRPASHISRPSALSYVIGNALVAKSFAAHCAASWGTSRECQNSVESTAPDLELVDWLRSLVLEVLTPPPVAQVLPLHTPACAGSSWCVKAEDLRRFADCELPVSDYVAAILGWASLPVRMPWRLVKSWGALAKVDGGIWLTLEELKAVAPFVRGWPGERLRRAMAKARWP